MANYSFTIYFDIDITNPTKFLKAIYQSLYDPEIEAEDEQFLTKQDLRYIKTVLEHIDNEVNKPNDKFYENFILEQADFWKKNLEEFLEEQTEDFKDMEVASCILDRLQGDISWSENLCSYRLETSTTEIIASDLFWEFVSTIWDRLENNDILTQDYFLNPYKEYLEENIIKPKLIKKAVGKIENYFLNAYYSPYTEIGKRRFDIEFKKLQ
jgi:hypothetical protein